VSLSGLLILDKPLEWTSHDVVGRVRRLAGERRVGHAGTLDPLATGVLLVCVGPATRLVEYLVGHDKAYETVVRLGQTTATYDAEGAVVRERPVTVSPAEIGAALARFRGPIVQRPPIYSAVKQDGQPLYKRARRGEPVEAPPREVAIHTLELLDWRPPLLELRVVCSSGTYIRSLAHDIGEALGTGGHVAALRRTAVGDFSLDEATPLADLSVENLAEHLRPPETAVRGLPRLDLDEDEARRLAQGQHLTADPARAMTGLRRVYRPDGRFLGVALASGGVWKAEKMLLDP
jgi:tRNA pseudouridine55 synthase